MARLKRETLTGRAFIRDVPVFNGDVLRVQFSPDEREVTGRYEWAGHAELPPVLWYRERGQMISRRLDEWCAVEVVDVW